MNRVSALEERPHRAPWTLPPYEDTVRRQPSMSQDALTRHWICWRLEPGLAASRSVRSRFLLFVRPPSMGFCYSSLKGIRRIPPTFLL